MQLYYIHHRQGRGLPVFAEGVNSRAALVGYLQDHGLPDDGLYDVWPTVIPVINNENW
jgi:hypothetical protein